MADFIDKLPNSKLIKLLEAMKIDPNENVIMGTDINCYKDKLHVFHGKDKHGNYIKSIYTDYAIEIIYNCTPSEYDQKRFQNIMKSLHPNSNYPTKCSAYNRKQKKLQEEDDFPENET